MGKFFLTLLLIATSAMAAENEFYVATAPNGDKYFMSLPHSPRLIRQGIFSADVHVYKGEKKRPKIFLLSVTGCREYGGYFQIDNGKQVSWFWRKDGQEFAFDILPTKLCRASGYRMRVDESVWPSQGGMTHWSSAH